MEAGRGSRYSPARRTGSPYQLFSEAPRLRTWKRKRVTPLPRRIEFPTFERLITSSKLIGQFNDDFTTHTDYRARRGDV